MPSHYLLITNLVRHSRNSTNIGVVRPTTGKGRFGCAYTSLGTQENRLVDKKAYLCVTKMQRYPIVLRSVSAQREEGTLWNEQI